MIFGKGGLAVTRAMCEPCKLSTTKLLGFETGVLRCSECGCVVSLKQAVSGSCPVYSSYEEYRVDNGR